MPRAPLTEEQKNRLREQLKVARAIRAAKLQATLIPPIPSDRIDVEVTGSPTMAQKSKDEGLPVSSKYEVTLESLIDKQPLEVCIRDVCWKGQTITITRANYQAITRHEQEGSPVVPYETIVDEVKRLLEEGGYKFRVRE